MWVCLPVSCSLSLSLSLTHSHVLQIHLEPIVSMFWLQTKPFSLYFSPSLCTQLLRAQNYFSGGNERPNTQSIHMCTNRDNYIDAYTYSQMHSYTHTRIYIQTHIELRRVKWINSNEFALQIYPFKYLSGCVRIVSVCGFFSSHFIFFVFSLPTIFNFSSCSYCFQQILFFYYFLSFLLLLLG